MCSSDLVLAVAQALVGAAGAPLLAGVLRTLKARLMGRRGPSPWQPYADLRKLLRKEAVVSTTTSWVFRVTPYVLVATMLVAIVVVPVVASRTALPFAGIILLMYLFLLGTFFLALAGLDSGSAFGGMGSSREWAAAMKLFVFLTLLANLFFPWGVPDIVEPVPVLLGLLALAGKLAVLTVALAGLETIIAKLRLFRVPELLAGSFALALLSVTAVFLVP